MDESVDISEEIILEDDLILSFSEISLGEISRSNNNVYEKIGDISDNSEVYKLSVSKKDLPNKKIDAILVRRDINDHLYEVEHYSMSGNKIATLLIRDNNSVENVQIHITDNMIIESELEQSTREEQSYYDCLNKTYKEYKTLIDENHPVACDLLNIFYGACTVVTVIYSAIECI